MKTKLLLILVLILTVTAAAASPPKGGKHIGQDHGKGHPLMFICDKFGWTDWRWCHSLGK